MVGVASKERGFAAGFTAAAGADAAVCAFVWLGAVDEDPKENGEVADPASADAPLLPSPAALFAPSVFALGAGLLLGTVNVNSPAATGAGVLAVTSSFLASCPGVAKGKPVAGAGVPKENPLAAGVAVVDAGVVVLVVPKENAPPAGAGAAGVAVTGVVVLVVPKENAPHAGAGATAHAFVVLSGVVEDPNENEGPAVDGARDVTGVWPKLNAPTDADAAGACGTACVIVVGACVVDEDPNENEEADDAGVALVGAVTAGGVDGPNMGAPNENIFVALSAGAGAKMDETGAAGWPSEKTGSAVGVGAVQNKEDAPVDVPKANGDVLVFESGKRNLELDDFAMESVQMLHEHTERRNPYNNEKKTYLRPLHVN